MKHYKLEICFCILCVVMIGIAIYKTFERQYQIENELENAPCSHFTKMRMRDVPARCIKELTK